MESIKSNLFATQNPILPNTTPNHQFDYNHINHSLQTENEVLLITVKHLQEELNGKSDVIRRQDEELLNLREQVIKL